jgi:hypothetical protein
MRKLVEVGLVAFWVAVSGIAAIGQTPTIASVRVAETGCVYNVGANSAPCSIGPGMTLTINGNNFGQEAGGVGLCDCNFSTAVRWKPTRVIVTVDWVAPKSAIALETPGGAWSNTVPYIALPPVITRVDVGSCSYVPNESRKQCVLTTGAQVTIHGRYFGKGIGEVATCDCKDNATIDSWNADWSTHPSPAGNTIVVTAIEAICGSTIVVRANEMWSNAVPYTTCGY